MIFMNIYYFVFAASIFIKSLLPILLKKTGNMNILLQSLLITLIEFIIASVLYVSTKRTYDKKYGELIKQSFINKNVIIDSILIFAVFLLSFFSIKKLPISISLSFIAFTPLIMMGIEKIFKNLLPSSFSSSNNYWKTQFIGDLIIAIGGLFIIFSKTKLTHFEIFFYTFLLFLSNVFASISSLRDKNEVLNIQKEVRTPTKEKSSIINQINFITEFQISLYPIIIVIFSILYSATYLPIIRKIFPKISGQNLSVKEIGLFILSTIFIIYVPYILNTISSLHIQDNIFFIMKNLKILYGFILGYIFFGEIIGKFKLIGGGIIIAGIIVLIILTRKDKKKDLTINSQIKKNYIS